jgi:hypothetical protein
LSSISLKNFIETGFNVCDTLNLSIVELVVKISAIELLSLSEWSVNSWPFGGLNLISFKSL